MEPQPAYGAVGAPPTVAFWRDIELKGDAACLGAARGRMQLVVALAGRFRSEESLTDMAARIGAVSATTGLRYWSSTEKRWRELISRSFALRTRDPKSARADFTAAEVLSGRTLYIAQNDTRSTGINVYSFRAWRVGKRRLVVEIVNLAPIRLFVLTMFERRALRTVHVLTREDDTVWAYYGVTAVVRGAGGGREASFINRAGAFYRLLAGIPDDREPPLSP